MKHSQKIFQQNIIDFEYNSEILKYTDYGIITYASTVCNELYIKNIPLLLLRSKTNDWTKKVYKTYNDLLEYLKNNDNLPIDIDKIFYILDIIYGSIEYIDDIKINTKTKLEDIFNNYDINTFKYIKNSEIKNLSNFLTDKNNQIFHAGTYEKNGKTYSNGGRVLNIISSSESYADARNNCLSNIKKINWTDGFFRKDIAWRVINKK